ncbi:MAG: PilZ domain-containing protein [Candidatus Omnitrophica bacterium]|nr:PilZ domain-containing protein [Candidatus Omnitrophota bacterium]MBU4478261.1 PilZ domain-containing protein [Candidatus Omnitrophota bacterium]MCG2703329.1 PilZ domain-containing protein [Candidatus Omnitrophota bacterium]
MDEHADKRKYLRLSGFLEGTFATDDGINGLIMLTNFSKEGLKASLNRIVENGKILKLEIWLPGSIIPTFMKGKVVWITKSSKEWTYDFDAGIKVLEINPEDRYRLMEFAYEHWRSYRRKE